MAPLNITFALGKKRELQAFAYYSQKYPAWDFLKGLYKMYKTYYFQLLAKSY